MKFNIVDLDPTPDDLRMLDKLRALPPDRREYVRALTDLLIETEHRSVDRRLLNKWTRLTRRDEREWRELTAVLRTGSWRDEVRRAERVRILKIAGGAR